MINVALDISVIVSGILRPRNRTGIFRYTHDLFRSLINDDRISLSLVFTKPYLGFVHEYLVNEIGKQSLLSSIQVDSWPLSAWSRSPVVRGMLKTRLCSGAIHALNILSPGAFYGRKEIKKLYVEGGIYHSPFAAMPTWLNRNKAKCLITIYDTIPLLFPQYFTKKQLAFFRRIIASIDNDINIICISQSTKNDLLSRNPGLDQENVFVVYPGISSNLFYKCTDQNRIHSVKTKIGIPTECEYVLSLSTLEPRKNTIMVVRSFAQLIRQERIQDLYLVLAGGAGWKQSPLVQELANLESFIREKIILTGYVENEDLAPLYSSALTFLYPSHYEGFGLPVAEAMQCGIPVIASNNSSLPEVVGNAGLLVDPQDIEAICQNVLTFYRSKSIRLQYASNSETRAELFTLRKSINNTIEVYSTVMNRTS